MGQSLSCWAVRFAEHNRHTFVTTDTNGLVQRYLTQIRDLELVRNGYTPSFTKDVAFVTALRTDKMTHVF